MRSMASIQNRTGSRARWRACLLSVSIWAAICGAAAGVDPMPSGQLGVVARASDEESKDRTSWVLLDDGRAPQVKVTDFKAPVLFRDVAPGIVKVRIVPRPVSRNGGIRGEGKVHVTAGRMIVLHVKTEVMATHKVTVMPVTNDDREGIRGAVMVQDVTGETPDLSVKVKTDARDRIVFWGAEGRAYRCHGVVAEPTLHAARSQAIRVGAQDVAVRWDVDPRIMALEFVLRADDGTARPAQFLKSIRVTADNGGNAVCPVDQSRAFVNLESGVFRGAGSLRIALDGDPRRAGAGYDIVENETVQVGDGEGSLSRTVVIAPKVFTGIHITTRAQGKSDASNARAYLINDDTTRRVHVDRPVEVSPGTYRLVAWAPGMKLERRDVDVETTGKPVPIAVRFSKAGDLAVRVSCRDDGIVRDATVRALYVEYPFLPPVVLAPAGNGRFAGKVDRSRKVRIAVTSAEYGGAVGTHDEDADVIDVRLVRPCLVTGAVRQSEEVAVEMADRKLGLVWADASAPLAPVAYCMIDEDGYTVNLQPGKYVVYVVGGASFARMGTARVEDPAMTRDWTVTGRIWRTATSARKIGLK